MNAGTMDMPAIMSKLPAIGMTDLEHLSAGAVADVTALRQRLPGDYGTRPGPRHIAPPPDDLAERLLPGLRSSARPRLKGARTGQPGRRSQRIDILRVHQIPAI